MSKYTESPAYRHAQRRRLPADLMKKAGGTEADLPKMPRSKCLYCDGKTSGFWIVRAGRGLQHIQAHRDCYNRITARK